MHDFFHADVDMYPHGWTLGDDAEMSDEFSEAQHTEEVSMEPLDAPEAEPEMADADLVYESSNHPDLILTVQPPELHAEIHQMVSTEDALQDDVDATNDEGPDAIWDQTVHPIEHQHEQEEPSVTPLPHDPGENLPPLPSATPYQEGDSPQDVLQDTSSTNPVVAPGSLDVHSSELATGDIRTSEEAVPKPEVPVDEVDDRYYSSHEEPNPPSDEEGSAQQEEILDIGEQDVGAHIDPKSQEHDADYLPEVEPPPSILMTVPSAGVSFFLFKGSPTETDSEDNKSDPRPVLFVQRPSLCRGPLSDLFEAFRYEEELVEYIDDGELLLECPDLELCIGEVSLCTLEIDPLS